MLSIVNRNKTPSLLCPLRLSTSSIKRRCCNVADATLFRTRTHALWNKLLYCNSINLPNKRRICVKLKYVVHCLLCWNKPWKMWQTCILDFLRFSAETQSMWQWPETTSLRPRERKRVTDKVKRLDIYVSAPGVGISVIFKEARIHRRPLLVFAKKLFFKIMS